MLQIRMALEDVKGKTSPLLPLDNHFRKNFVRGQKDTFRFTKEEVGELKHISKIFLFVEKVEDNDSNSCPEGHWMADLVVVKNHYAEKDKKVSIFPVHR